MAEMLRLLLVEDEEDDALLLLRLLEKEGFTINHRRIQLASEMESALENEPWDMIICDYRLPKFSGSDALAIYKKKNLDIPFILLSGTVGEDIAVEMMKSGAHDYIMKDHLLQMGPAIRRALGDAEVRRQKKQALEDLRMAKEKAEKSDRVRSTLLSNMSHEFRTPLTGILGFARIIMEGGKGQDIRKCAHKIFNSGQRLMKTLDSIVILSQIESGIKPVFSEFDLHSLINKVMEDYREFSEYKSITVEKKFQGRFLVKSDEELLYAACSAILDNAIKFTHRGGIRIDTLKTFFQDVPMSGFSIEDDGIGISEENLERIFEAFQQVSEGYSRHYEGIGLGLTIAKRLSGFFGGTIHVESTPGKGSKFTFLFPSFPAETGQEGMTGSQTETILPPVKEKSGRIQEVLVVEDHETNAELVTFYLSRQYATETANSGEEAIILAGRKKYDIILMDINLGSGIDGIETMHEIRKIDSYQDTPVIALTGYTQFGDRERLIKEGFQEYIAKPFDKKTLMDCLRSVPA